MANLRGGTAPISASPCERLKGGPSVPFVSFHREPRSFGEADVQVAELFAERAAVALDNHQLYQQQQVLNASLADEVARQTAALKAAQARAIERERLAAIGTFAASIVHELRNPTTTIKMALEFFPPARPPR